MDIHEMYQEENVSETKLDKKQEKYLALINFEDDVLGELVLEKSEGLFEGKYNSAGNDITIYIEVEWSSKATWKVCFGYNGKYKTYC